MVFNRDCRKLLKIKYFFTFLFVLRPIFASVVPKIKPEVLACTDVRASCVLVDVSSSCGESRRARRALQECFVSPGELRKGCHLTIYTNIASPEGIPAPNISRTTRLDCVPCTILFTIRDPQGYWATLKVD